MCRTSVLCACLIAGLVLSAAGAASEDQRGQRWAVVVGVNDYAELEDLQYCKSDASALRDRLVEVGFPEENVFLLADGAADAKDRPTKANIETRIGNVLAVAEQGDLVLVSFSGHGMHLDGTTFLCPTGARIDNPEGTMIPLPAIYRKLDRCKASRKLLWADACRDDPRPGGSKSAAAHAKSVAGVVESLKAPPEGILTLSSCGGGEVSFEDQSLGHSIFMHFVLEGLSGKADEHPGWGNGDGLISLLELFQYTSQNTKRRALRAFHAPQCPECTGRMTSMRQIVCGVTDSDGE